jgi:predicted RNase H-like nuclease (RuvC/YqgF family)
MGNERPPDEHIRSNEAKREPRRHQRVSLLTDAAEQYVNRSPRIKRIQEQRSTLLDAIANAQLILSVHQLPKEPSNERSSTKDKAPVLEKEVKAMRERLTALDKNLKPVSKELEALEKQAGKARTLIDTALAKHGSEHEAIKSETVRPIYMDDF